jgi:hypothetical protein
MLDVEINHQPFILLYFLRMELDAADQSFFLLQKELFLVGALFNRDLVADIGLYLLNLVIEGRDGGNNSIEFSVALACDIVR